MASRLLRTLTIAADQRVLGFWNTMLAGGWLVCWLHQTASAFGTSLVSMSAILCSTGLGLAAGLWFAGRPAWIAGRSSGSEKLNLWVLPGLNLLLAAAGPLSGVAFESGLGVSSIIAGGSEWAGPGRQWLALLAGSGVSLLPLVALVSFVIDRSSIASVERAAQRTALGLAAGILLTTFGLFPMIGLQNSMMLLAVGNCIACGAGFWLATRKRPARQCPEPDLQASPRGRDLQVTTTGVCAGIAFALLCRMTEQWMMAAAWVTVAQWSAVLIGIAVCGFIPRRLRSSSTTNWSFCVWCIGLTTMFPAIVALSIDVNSWISSIATVTAIRTALIVLAIAPAGLYLGSNPGSMANGSGLPRPLTTAAFVAGLLLTRWFLLPETSWTRCLVAVCVVLFVSGIVTACFEATTWSRSTIVRLARHPAFAASALALVATPLWSTSYRVDLSARLLFDTNVFLANRVETRADLLPWLNESRCLSIAESDQHTITLWRSHGSRLQLRESGLATSVVSTNADLYPESTAESLQALLPLTLHPHPKRLLLLGIGTGAVLKTSLAFPVQDVTCIEGDGQQLGLVRESVFPQLDVDPSTDNRIRMVHADPPLALRSTKQQFDVIISDAGNFALSSEAAESTAEFLTQGLRVAGPKGLFCQRLVYADLGPDAVREIYHTWQSVFPHVAAIESGSGEWLMIGTARESGIFPNKIVARLKRPHVRYALSRIGWDWATPLQLAVYQGQHLAEIFESDSSSVSRITNARLLTRLPWEVMRWGNKYNALMEQVAPCRQQLADVFPDERSKPEVTRRFTELAEQQQIVQLAHDRYWAYRKSVKHYLTNSPRTKIIQVKGEQADERLHAEEQQRLDYFEALGAAAKQRNPSPDALLAIEAFEAPYDPLISFFMHQEIAELAARNRQDNAAIELRHRLHRAHFATPGDRSVRNIIAAIELMCERPELIENDAERGDHLDALLQLLHGRWQNRGDIQPDSSEIMFNDIEKSLQAVQAASDELSDLASTRGMSTDDWKRRQLVLQKSLVRPLRDYRSMLTPHRVRERRRQN